MKQNILAKKINILKQRTKHFMLTYGITGLALGTPLCFGCQNDKIQQNKTETKKDTIVTVKPVEIKNPVATIAYYTDTLYHATSTIMRYNQGKVTRNYVENNGSFYLKMPIVVHEDWHRHNSQSGFRLNSKISPYEYYKLCIQDEMTANLAAILTARYEYLRAQNKKAIIKKYEKSYMGFYFKAIKAKKIKPNALEMDDKERAFLANGVKKMWLDTYYEHYAPRLYRMIPRYVERRDLYPSAPKLYKKYVSYFWTIGGIDFSKYLESDIEIKQDEQLMLIDDMKDVHCLKKDASFLVNNVTANMPRLKNFALQDRQAALLNLMVSAKLKSELKAKDSAFLTSNPEVITATYNKVMFEVVRDSTFYQFLDKCSFMDNARFSLLKKTDKLEEKIRAFYVYKEVDLSKQIKNFKLIKTMKPHYLSDDLFMTFYFDSKQKNCTQNAASFPLINDAHKAFSPVRKAADTLTASKPKRISEKQFIDIPNFWEPILAHPNEKSNRAIFQMMEDFNNVPWVLKSCNTEQILQYWQKNEFVPYPFAKSNQAIR